LVFAELVRVLIVKVSQNNKRTSTIRTTNYHTGLYRHRKMTSLMGTFDVYCANCNHVTRVHRLTHKKDCDSCGQMVVNHGSGLLVCHSCGQHDLVGGSTMHHKCSKCGNEVKLRGENDSNSSSDDEATRQPRGGMNIGTTGAEGATTNVSKETRTVYTKVDVDKNYQ
jgi:predicted RNA-binding Zn-ribbon protein involved in translation (DUF1610 family)